MESTEVPVLSQMLSSCWPWLLAIVLCVGLLRVLMALMQIRIQLRRIGQLVADERGGVQTLSFVLTVPLFLFVMMFIVQLSQITIGQIGVEYAAFAAARSAIVWIPAQTVDEPAMTVGVGREFQGFRAYSGDREISFDVEAYMDPNVAFVPPGTSNIFTVFEVIPGGSKYEKIRTAAALALMNITPSRPVITSQSTHSAVASFLLSPMEKASLGVAPSTATNPRWSARLSNKLTYALESTAIRIRVWHKDSSASPFLQIEDLSHDRYQYRLNEIDWQDQIVVDVVHEFALLPGPGRLLARRADARPGTGVDESYGDNGQKDRIAAAISRRDAQTYTYPLFATARLTVEGFQPQQMLIQPAAATADWASQTSPNYATTGIPGAQ